MTENQLMGTAARVASLFGDGIRVESLYGPDGSKLYHNFTLHDTAEIDELLALAEGRPSPILELACGSGRITLPLLRQGFEVIGLDNSPSMLELLAERLSTSENDGLGENLTTIEGDMTSFDLERSFSLIVLGATAIWNLDEKQRGDVFRAVARHLTEDGRFLLTVLTYEGLENSDKPIENLSLFVANDGTSPALCTFMDYAEPNGLRVTSVLSQRVQDGTVVDTKVYSARTHLVPAPALVAEIERAGLCVVAEHEVTSRHQISSNTTAQNRRRLLFEVALP